MEKTMDSKVTFRMSSAGKCPRALSAQLLNMEAEGAPSWLEQAANEGNWHEDRIIQDTIAKGGTVDRRQLEVALLYPSFDLIGHIDGMVKFGSDDNWQLLEIKSMSQFEFDRWMKGRFEAFPNYAAQITCYMEATKLKSCLYIVKNRSSGYEDRQVIEKPMAMTQIIANLTEANNYYLSGQLVPREPDLNSIECRRCEYKKLCIPEPKELTALEGQALLDITNNWRIGKDLVDKGQKIINEAKEALEEHTRATNQVKWSFNKLAIQLIQVKEGEVAYHRKASEYLKITDLEKNNG